MASGRTHRTITRTFAPLLGAACGSLAGSLALGVAVALGCYAGVWVHPDWDIDKHAPLWRWPYAKAIAHRSPLSHWPVLGTLGRLAYLGLLASPLWVVVEVGLWVAGRTEPLVWVTWYELALGAGAVGGLMVSDALHWVWDQGWWRRVRRMFGQERRGNHARY
jgi:uncharacterized metal-binding protein